MINETAKSKYEMLLEDFESFNGMGISAAQLLKGKLNVIRNILSELRVHYQKVGFAGQEEEIDFFKYWKPLFVGHFLFEQEVYKIKINAPINDPEALKTYFKEELIFIEKFNSKYQFMREYFLADGTELDGSYFMRNVVPINPIWSEMPELDPEFSTSGDSLFAKFKCNDWLKNFLITSLVEIDQSEASKFSTTSATSLHWTGELVNAVELAYGLWLTGQFNNGNASLNQIVRWLESHWGLNIGIPQRRFAEIGARKRLSQTRYIDQIKEAILNKIETERS